MNPRKDSLNILVPVDRHRQSVPGALMHFEKITKRPVQQPRLAGLLEHHLLGILFAIVKPRVIPCKETVGSHLISKGQASDLEQESISRAYKLKRAVLRHRQAYKRIFHLGKRFVTSPAFLDESRAVITCELRRRGKCKGMRQKLPTRLNHLQQRRMQNGNNRRRLMIGRFPCRIVRPSTRDKEICPHEHCGGLVCPCRHGVLSAICVNSIRIRLYEKVAARWPYGGRKTIFLRGMEKVPELQRQIVDEWAQRAGRRNVSPIWSKKVCQKRLRLADLLQCHVQNTRRLLDFS